MNVKEEFLEFIENKAKVIAAMFSYVCYDKDFYLTGEKIHVLKKNYSKSEWDSFIESIGFCDDGQINYLNGTIWFSDGSWAQIEEIGEFVGWRHHVLPEIPQELIKEKA